MNEQATCPELRFHPSPVRLNPSALWGHRHCPVSFKAALMSPGAGAVTWADYSELLNPLSEINFEDSAAIHLPFWSRKSDHFLFFICKLTDLGLQLPSTSPQSYTSTIVQAAPRHRPMQNAWRGRKSLSGDYTGWVGFSVRGNCWHSHPKTVLTRWCHTMSTGNTNSVGLGGVSSSQGKAELLRSHQCTHESQYLHTQEPLIEMKNDVQLRNMGAQKRPENPQEWGCSDLFL